MDDLIEALTILRKYGNPEHPTHCEHDELTVAISPEGVSEDDINKLDELGFYAVESMECFCSHKFGSC
ncbi:MAG: hypothetical protein M0R50_03315 [Candidatus Cloacimonetes bacterium]|jgi:hypothetical protein|nr:hypothetical protein [Candidatus Cloacimonadota bacterium]